MDCLRDRRKGEDCNSFQKRSGYTLEFLIQMGSNIQIASSFVFFGILKWERSSISKNESFAYCPILKPFYTHSHPT